MFAFPELVPWLWLNLILVPLLVFFGLSVGYHLGAWLVGRLLK